MALFDAVGIIYTFIDAFISLKLMYEGRIQMDKSAIDFLVKMPLFDHLQTDELKILSGFLLKKEVRIKFFSWKVTKEMLFTSLFRAI